MNLIRGTITVFMATVLALCVAGWVWADQLPSPKMEGARIALGLSGLMAAASVGLIWKERTQ